MISSHRFLSDFSPLRIVVGVLMIGIVSATTSFQTSQCTANKPLTAVNYFSAFQTSSASNCSAAASCLKSYCQCLNGTWSASGSPQCGGLSSTTTCDTQSFCVQSLLTCVWAAAASAQGTNASDTCSSWGTNLITQLGYFASNVTAGNSLTFGATDVGKSCAWLACAQMSTSIVGGTACTVQPDYVCSVPVALATSLSGVNSSIASNDNVTVAAFSITIPGDFDLFFTDSAQNGKLKYAFTQDLVRAFQTSNVLLSTFQNGSLKSDFTVIVPSNNPLAVQTLQNAPAALSATPAYWLQNTRATWNAAGNVGTFSPTVVTTGTFTMTAHGATTPCGDVCFQFIVILGGAAILVLVLCCGFCCVCCKREDDASKLSSTGAVEVTVGQVNNAASSSARSNRL